MNGNSMGTGPDKPAPAHLKCRKRGQFHGNQWTRREMLRMFITGNSLWLTARHLRVRPNHVEAELREELIQGGSFERLRGERLRRAAR